jgi:hypothetical protein
MSLVLSNLRRIASGAQVTIIADAAFDSTYPTGGENLTAASVGLSRIDRIRVDGQKSGYLYDGVVATDTLSAKIIVYSTGSGAGGNTGLTSGGTPAGTNGTSAVTGTGTGTATGGTFTGSTPPSSVNLTTPRFSGTGLTAAGQVITTTDNQTMLLNEAAGMWLLSATGATPPNLILSNTAVTNAPAVLTVQGAASTDAGTYRIVTGPNAAGSVGSGVVTVSGLTATAAAQTFTGAALGTHLHTVAASGGASEIPNGTDLSALTGVQIEIVGA